MADQQRGTGGGTILADEHVERLRAGVRGPLLRPGDADFDAARKVWNGMVDRTPGLIARCAGVADVVRAVDFAREQGLSVAVRGGGHNAAGLAVCDGGLVVDLTPMKGIRVDPAGRTVRAEGGVTWGEFDRETQLFGLATTGGAVSTTGIAGLTLGGGLGWLMRSYGLACDNLISADVVTADGRVVTASATENADLFWGLRGGGGNFGVVTSFEFRLHPVGPVLGGLLVHPLARAKEALRFYRDFTQTAPDALTVFAGLMTSPDGHPIVAFVICYNGPIDEGERVIRPLREYGPPLADQVGPMAYTQLQSMLDEGFPSGLQVYWRSDFLSGLGDETVDAIVARHATVASPLSATLIEQFGGAVKRIGREETAFDYRDADYNLVIISRWTDPADSERHIAWARSFREQMQPHTRGVYVNYLGVGEGEDRVRAAYGAAKYDRLVALKNAYDPANLFCYNQNIKPTV
jgi:FAD/FMN-containing dehydrogenase